MRLSSLDFRGIFQTILKKAVFWVASTFLSIFYKRAEYERHAFLQILVFCLFWQPHFKPTASYRPHSMTAVQPSWLHAASIAETFSPYRDAYNKQLCRPMYVGRPSVSADSDHSFALIAQMQATAQAASFSSSHPVASTPYTKHGTPSVLCAAAAYRYLIGDSTCIFQCSLVFILPHVTPIIHQSSFFYSSKA